MLAGVLLAQFGRAHSTQELVLFACQHGDDLPLDLLCAVLRQCWMSTMLP